MDIPAGSVPKPTPPTKPKPRILLVLIVVGLILVAAGMWWLVWQRGILTANPAVANNSTVATNTANEGDTATNAAGTTDEAKVTTIKDPGVTWLKALTPIADQGVITFAANPSIDTSQTKITYYQAGQDDRGGIIVLVTFPVDGLGGDFQLLMKKDVTGQWTVLTRYSDVDPINRHDYVELKKDVLRSDGSLPSLDLPDRLTVTNTKFLQQGSSFGLRLVTTDTGLSPTRTLADTAYGPLVEFASPYKTADDKSVGQTSSLGIRRSDLRYTTYNLAPSFLRDDQTLNVQAVSALSLAGKYAIQASGCGGSSSAYILSEQEATPREKVATSEEGDIYALTSDSNPVLQNYYNEYKTSREYSGSNVTAVDYASFVVARPVLIWQDGFGRWVTLRNGAYATLAECGKPVVYLYPEKAQTVTVQVGANVTKSEPAYGTGWTAWATPNGTLTVAGRSYPYLFWEGHGTGLYPTDVNQYGVVVARADAVPTLRQQLGQLGLTKQEGSDFLDFWAERLPQTPYVRLTWLTTGAMNQIAPLTINPKPDTVIRVFLDFAGLAQPQTLKSQALRSIPRRGFTVVEWGGLLR